MLILTRKINEIVILYDETNQEIGRIMVVSIRGDRVQLGLDFLPHITIARDNVTTGRPE